MNFTGKDILPSNQQQIIEQATFTYSPLEEAFEKTNKNNWRPRRNKTLEDLKSKEQKKQLRVDLIINQWLQLYLTILLKKEKA